MTRRPIDLDAERQRRSEGYPGAICACGEAWFDARVVIAQDGHVTGYEWPPKCASCGKPLHRTRRS